MNKVLVTGSTGFIGKQLCNRLPDAVRVIRSRNTSHTTQSEVFEVDNIDASTNWEGAFSSVDTVIHLAGLAHSHSYTAADYHSVNVEGSIRLASAAAQANVKRFIFVSTIGVNGNSSIEPFSCNSIVKPHSDYAQSKYEAEKALEDIANKTGMELVIVRPTLVYGPEAPGNFALLVSLVKALPFLPFGNIRNKRSFISVYNLVDLLITCIGHPNAAGKVLLPSDGESVSIELFTSHIAAGLGKKVMQIPIPQGLMKIALTLVGKKSTYEQLYGNLEVESKEVYNLLGWTPPFSIAEVMGRLKESEIK